MLDRLRFSLANVLLVLLGATFVTGCDAPVPEQSKGKADAPSSASGGPDITASSVKLGANIPEALPNQFAHFSRSEGGACGFDPSVHEGDLLFISGWASIAVAEGVLPESVLLAVSSEGVEQFVMASSAKKRDDVAKYFASPKLIDSGFNAYVKASSLPKHSRVILYQAFQGKLYRCSVSLEL
jgi:hypothetical protein